MKRKVSLLLVLLLAIFTVTGCGDSGYTGSYALLEHDGITYLVVKWTYPSDDIVGTDFIVDESPLDPYIDESYNTAGGEGLPLNYMEGIFTYERSYFSWHPVKVPPASVSSINGRVSFILTVTGDDGTVYNVTLRYDPAIKVAENK